MARRSGWSNGAAARESGKFKWGTGINPVHNIVGDVTAGRDVNANQTAGGTHPPTAGFAEVPLEITDSYYYIGAEAEASPWVGIPSEYDSAIDSAAVISPIYGYTDDSGASDRPDLGTPTQEFRGSTDLYRGRGWPSWGPTAQGAPGGTMIRDQNHGATVTKKSKEVPSETVTEGWRNKERLQSELLADYPEVIQYLRQTSMVQRFMARKGSQRGEGSQSIQEPAHSIESRLAPPKVKPWSGGERHYDMLPKAQEEIVRTWWSRRAGTAPSSLLQTNDQLPIDPLIRNPPPDPYQGGDSQATADEPNQDFGYASEDYLPYV